MLRSTTDCKRFVICPYENQEYSAIRAWETTKVKQSDDFTYGPSDKQQFRCTKIWQLLIILNLHMSATYYDSK